MTITVEKFEEFNLENLFNELFALESLLKVSKKSHLLELFYNNGDKITDAEVNDFINILNIALEKINNLKELNYKLERELNYKRTPTIAADK